MVIAALLLLQAAPDIAGAATAAVERQECKATAQEDEVVVCARRRDRSPYRLPERKQFDPSGNMPSVMRERVAWIEDGDVGPGSCTAVGPGGWTGCLAREWKRERDQTQWGKNVPTKRW